MTLHRVACGLALMLCAAGSARGTLVVKPDIDEMTRGSHAVIVGQVVGSHSEWSDRREVIWTYTTIAVQEAAKGQFAPGSTLTIRELGGSVGDQSMEMIGAPKFGPGEHVLLFVRRAEDGSRDLYQTSGLSQGKFVVTTDARTGRSVAVRNTQGLGFVGGRETIFDDGPVDLEILMELVRLHAAQ